MHKIYILTKEGIIEEQRLDAARQIARKKRGIVWVDLRSFDEKEVLAVAQEFGFHAVAVDSILNPYSRPHLVEYEDYFHVNFTYIEKPQGEDLNPQELHVFLAENYIITAASNGSSELIDQVLSRYRGVPTITGRGSFYALYLLVDLLVDTYFPIAEGLDDEIDELEDKILLRADQESLEKLLLVKRRLFDLRRLMGPQRDVFNELARRDFPFLREDYQVYFQDTYNRMIRVFDVMDTAREIVTGALDIYQSSVSNRLNDVMRLLTVFAAILGTLTFITGFFGMNFVFFPGLRSRMAIPFVIIGMMLITAAMVFLFRRKKWL